jgi:hypothetical protein
MFHCSLNWADTVCKSTFQTSLNSYLYIIIKYSVSVIGIQVDILYSVPVVDSLPQFLFHLQTAIPLCTKSLREVQTMVTNF